MLVRNVEAAEKHRSIRIDIQGVVQGVGFRPYIYNLAVEHGLSGYVGNNSDGVEIEVEGPSKSVDAFLAELPARKPPLSFLSDLKVSNVPARSATAMEIRPSRSLTTRAALIPPDVTVCEDCLRELEDHDDRRYGYPFINCTNCGPRYTIIDDIPYDRPKTSMATFSMCPKCQAEYSDPHDRRFHAQPNACPVCGPKVWLSTADGTEIPCDDPLREAGRRLESGQILAVKGLGGFHLAVDATRDDEVSTLRKLKHHEEKPLAVMCRSLAEAKQLAHIDEQARSLLCSVHRPIVIVPKRHPSPLASCIAPVNHNVGLMLPYTPLHVLLLASAPPALVMTSGNLTDEPIAIDNEEALTRLSGIADAFLLHDRDILVPNDDSVLRIIAGRPSFIRRSRGYVPLPVVLEHETPPILTVGGELKNTICITRGRMAFLSQHIGDMENPSAIEYFTETVDRLSRILDVKPRLIAADLHPDYAATRWAEQHELQVVKVQHHHAHIASCMAEHRIEGPVIGVALDGTGFGTDGKIWGGEILVCDLAGFERVGHLDYVQLPGGDRAVAEPWRMALSYLLHTFGNAWEEHLPEDMRRIPAKKRQAVIQMMKSGVNSPWTSSCGRLFDGVAALLGLHHKVAFEAQAAMGLEMVAGGHDGNAADGGYEIQPRAGNDGFLIDPADFVRGVVGDIERGLSARAISRRFHAALAHTFSLACELPRRQTGLNQVALSGGVFQNRLLTEGIVDELEAAGFDVLLHKQVPANDGGLSLGQAVVAAHRSLTAFGKNAAQGL